MVVNVIQNAASVVNEYSEYVLYLSHSDNSSASEGVLEETLVAVDTKRYIIQSITYF